jgi:hypothetical protein
MRYGATWLKFDKSVSEKCSAFYDGMNVMRFLLRFGILKHSQSERVITADVFYQILDVTRFIRQFSAMTATQFQIAQQLAARAEVPSRGSELLKPRATFRSKHTFTYT